MRNYYCTVFSIYGGKDSVEVINSREKRREEKRVLSISGRKVIFPKFVINVT